MLGWPRRSTRLILTAPLRTQVQQLAAIRREALTMIGKMDQRYKAPAGRGTGAAGSRSRCVCENAVTAGERVNPETCSSPCPICAGQLVAQDFSKYTQYAAVDGIPANGAVMQANVTAHDMRQKILDIVHDVRALIKKSKVQVPGQCELEISHHYGMEKFRESGLTAFTVINRDYCKTIHGRASRTKAS